MKFCRMVLSQIVSCRYVLTGLLKIHTSQGGRHLAVVCTAHCSPDGRCFDGCVLVATSHFVDNLSGVSSKPHLPRVDFVSFAPSHFLVVGKTEYVRIDRYLYRPLLTPTLRHVRYGDGGNACQWELVLWSMYVPRSNRHF